MTPHSRHPGGSQEAGGAGNGKRQGVHLAWGKLSVSAWGWPTLFVLGIAGIIVANIWTAYNYHMTVLREFQDRQVEHVDIAQSHDLMTCVLTLTTEQRDQFRREYRDGAEVSWCPWLRGNRKRPEIKVEP